MKKILGLPISLMVLGLLLISAGKLAAAPYPFHDDFESVGLVIGLQEGNGI